MAKLSGLSFRRSASSVDLSSASLPDVILPSESAFADTLARKLPSRTKRFLSLSRLHLSSSKYYLSKIADETEPPAPPPNTPLPEQEQVPRPPKSPIFSLLRRATSTNEHRQRSVSFSLPARTVVPQSSYPRSRSFSGRSGRATSPYPGLSSSANGSSTSSLEGLELSEAPKDGSITILVPGSMHENPSTGSLPTPPIILSAPTPPDAVRSVTFESLMVHQTEDTYLVKAPPSTQPSTLRQTRGDIYAIAHTLQFAARQVEADPSFDQNVMFKSAAPVVAFLYVLLVGVLLLRQPAISTESWISKEHVTGFVFIGLFTTLAITRALIWIVSAIGHSFCALDVEEALRTGECLDSHGEHFTQTEVLVGGIFGS